MNQEIYVLTVKSSEREDVGADWENRISVLWTSISVPVFVLNVEDRRWQKCWNIENGVINTSREKISFGNWSVGFHADWY